MNTFDRVRAILVETLGAKEEAITPQTSLTDDLAADSLALVEMTIALEEEFCVEFGEEVLALTTVAQIVEYVEGKLGEQA